MNKIQEAIAQRKISGDGAFSKRCAAWLEAETGSKKALLTTSCSDALELAALLADIHPGDEVICPSRPRLEGEERRLRYHPGKDRPDAPPRSGEFAAERFIGCCCFGDIAHAIYKAYNRSTDIYGAHSSPA